jgi:urate oxidase
LAIVLSENRYGKAENRLVRVTRHDDHHEILDLNVSVQLSGDFDETHYTGNNSQVLPTDTQKNTIYALAQEHGSMAPEAFGLLLANHFLSSQPHVKKAEIRMEKYAWKRIPADGLAHPRAFMRDNSATRVATVVVEKSGSETNSFIVTGLQDLVVLKTTDSEFTNYMKDHYTTLPETTDRVMATQVSARWRHTAHDAKTLSQIDWDNSYENAEKLLLATFANHYSLSLQQTLYAMGQAVLEDQSGLCQIKLSLPNKHHFLVDLAPFGQANENEVFFAADRPYGLIEAIITRDDAPSAGPIWPGW